MRNSEKGQVLPVALLALAAGVLIIIPFLGHASSSLVSSRIYGQAITEQYSCDAGVEWALWRLKENPTLTTDTTYHSTSLEPIPSEVNGSSFPTTLIRFVEAGVTTETITPEWQDGEGWHDYPINPTATGTATVVIDNITASQVVLVRMKERPEATQNFWGDGPYIAVFDLDQAGPRIVQVKLPPETKYGPLEPGPITITITYPVAGDGDGGVTETIIPEWQTGASWVRYPFRATDAGVVLVIVGCDADVVIIKLHGAPGQPGTTPYIEEVEPVSPHQPDQEIWVQTLVYDEQGRLVPYDGPGTITITYPIASYDVRVQKGDCTITVRATASYLVTRVISWQVE